MNFTNDLLLLIAFFRNQGCNYPLKGGKDTFWGGGVRGVGFVHSNLISKKSRVSYDLIDVTDWLPTFYHLAGGDVTAIQDKIDGMNVWDTIALGKKSPRTEVLNIHGFYKCVAFKVSSIFLRLQNVFLFVTKGFRSFLFHIPPIMSTYMPVIHQSGGQAKGRAHDGGHSFSQYGPTGR